MVRFLAIAATIGVIGLGPTPVAVAAVTRDMAPASLAAPVYEPSTTWSAGNGCYYPNCTAAHNAKEGNIPKGDPHYCEAQDRDGDGIACEW